MVSFRTFFEVVHETATRKGLSGEGTQRIRRSLTAQIGTFWTENEDLVRGWSEAEARQWAEENVTV